MYPGLMIILCSKLEESFVVEDNRVIFGNFNDVYYSKLNVVKTENPLL